MFRKLIFSSLIISFSLSTYALETDQFIAATVTLKDSSDIINDYYLTRLNKVIEKANKKNYSSDKCQVMANKALGEIVGKFSISAISKFARTSPLVERFPDDSVSDRDYFGLTIYDNATFFMKMANLSRTINFNGIHMGTDKLGHFSLIGRTYYHYYLNYLKEEKSNEEALVLAIKKGIKTETGMLGYAIGGVLSFGDMEANYQGLRFAIDMCEGAEPYFVYNGSKWELNKNNPVNMRKYFNPKMDESYNFSFWRPYFYKRIKDRLKMEYCAVKNNPMYIERMNTYKSLVQENLNDKILKEVILSKEKFDRNKEDILNMCD